MPPLLSSASRRAARSARWSLRESAWLLCVVVMVLRALAVPASCSCESESWRIGNEAQRADERCSACPFERNGDACPPDCPTCHCSQQGVSLPPVARGGLLMQAVADPALGAAPYEASVPRAPPAPGLYRPPRFAPSVS